MVKVRFQGKKTKIGNSYFVLIPKGIADILLSDIGYEFTIDGKGQKNEVKQNGDITTN